MHLFLSTQLCKVCAVRVKLFFLFFVFFLEAFSSKGDPKTGREEEGRRQRERDVPFLLHTSD